MSDLQVHSAHELPTSTPEIAEIIGLLAQVTKKLEPGNQEVRQWMMDHCHEPRVSEILQDSTLMTLRVINAIGQLEPVNGITIAKQFQIPKGSVSKITQRLLTQRLIQKETLPNNKKEVLFRLTPLGYELFTVHHAFDQQMARGLIHFLERYSTDELQLIGRVLQDVLQSSFLALGMPRTPGHAE